MDHISISKYKYAGPLPKSPVKVSIDFSDLTSSTCPIRFIKCIALFLLAFVVVFAKYIIEVPHPTAAGVLVIALAIFLLPFESFFNVECVLPATIEIINEFFILLFNSSEKTSTN